MATPKSQEADQARGYFARERRRKLQDLSAFKTAGYVDAPFDFGTVPAGGNSANFMDISAGIDIVMEHTEAAVPVGGMGIRDINTLTNFFTNIETQAGGIVPVNHYFHHRHRIRIKHTLGTAAGLVNIYFSGPRSQITLIGFATFL